MKKTILISLILLTSCIGETPSYIEGTTERGADKEIRYFKDSRTGICFAEVGQTDTYAFTCVPCDSVAKLIHK